MKPAAVLAALLVLAGTGVPPRAHAEDEAVRLEDIEVTAEKRVKAQRDIPGSVGALRGEDLEAMKAQGMKDYLKLIPGVTYEDLGNEESAPVIRGITSGFNTGQAAAGTTGIYMDDMPFADLYIPLSYPDVNPFDLDRVEVLKGPQGTLYGASALAGAVRYIVHRPDFGLWEGKGSETVSRTHDSHGLARVTAGALNVPLGDSFALRIVGVGRREPGLYDEGAKDNSGNFIRNDRDADRLAQTSGRILASWNPPIEELKLSAFYFGQKTRTDDWGIADQPDTPQAGEINSYPYPSPREHEFGGGNFLATYDFDWARLTSSSNLLRKKNYVDIQNEAATTGGHDQQTKDMIIFGNEVKGYTQEFRLSSPEGGDASDWEWVVGASYMRWGMNLWELEWAGQNIADPTSPEQISAAQKQQALVFATIDQMAHEKALFGEVTRKLGDHFEATVGARKFSDDLATHNVGCGTLVIALGQTPCIDETKTTDDSGVSPKLSLRYVHNAHVQVYALAAKGFQFGGFQINPPVAAVQQSAQAGGYAFAPYKSSDLWNYESGIRTEWLDRRLRFDAAFFYMDWKDLQLTVVVPLIAPTPGPNQQITVLANVGRAHSTGAETVFSVMPFAGARFTSSAAWISALTDVDFDNSNPAGPVPAGTRLPGTPRFQWSNVASYEHALPYFDSWLVVPALTHFHMGPAPNLLRATGTIGGYDTFDARVAFTKPDSRFVPELGIGVSNLTDRRGVASVGQGVGPKNEYHFIPPRTVLATLSLKY